MLIRSLSRSEQRTSGRAHGDSRAGRGMLMKLRALYRLVVTVLGVYLLIRVIVKWRRPIVRFLRWWWDV